MSAPLLADVGRVADARLEAAERRRVVADLGRVVRVERLDHAGADRVDHRAVDAAGAGRHREAADRAVVDRAVLVAEAELAEAAAQEQPGLVGVVRAVRVRLELDRAAILDAGRVMRAAGDDVDLGVVREVQAAATVRSRRAVVQVAAMRPEIDETRNGHVQTHRQAEPRRRCACCGAPITRAPTSAVEPSRTFESLHQDVSSLSRPDVGGRVAPRCPHRRLVARRGFRRHRPINLGLYPKPRPLTATSVCISATSAVGLCFLVTGGSEVRPAR